MAIILRKGEIENMVQENCPLETLIPFKCQNYSAIFINNGAGVNECSDSSIGNGGGEI